MSTTTQRTCGASAYTQPVPHATRPLADEGLFSEPVDGTHVNWAGTIDRLLALRGLEDDWDGQAAVAPAAAVVDTALRVALNFRSVLAPPPDRVLAGANGTVFFEWFSPARYTEIEVTAPGRAEGRVVSRDSGATDEFTLVL